MARFLGGRLNIIRLKGLSIGVKLVSTVAILMSLIMTAIAIVINHKVQEMAYINAKVIAEEVAYRYANKVEMGLKETLKSARTLADVFEAKLHDNLALERYQASSILKHFIETNPNTLAAFVVFEPNGYDAEDAQFINNDGHDEKGRFMPYWSRQKKELLVLKPFKTHIAEAQPVQDCYQLLQKGQKVCLAEPHHQIVQGQEKLVTALVVAVVDTHNRFKGVLGVEISLEHLKQQIHHITITHPLFKHAYATLYSNQGIVIASEDASYAGRSVQETTHSSALIQGVLSHQKFFTERMSKTLDSAVITYGAPIKVGHTNTPWMLAVNIPKAELRAEATQLALWIIGISVLATFIMTLVIYWLARHISNLLSQLVSIFEAISAGDLTHEIPLNRQDEIGRLLQALSDMQIQLRARLSEEKRIADEALRINQALDNAGTAVLITAPDHKIIYANQSAKKLFQEKQAIIRRQLPQFDATRLIGCSIDEFHKTPTQQHEILSQLATTHEYTLKIENLTIKTKINPITNAQGQQLGWVSEYYDRTTEAMTEQEIDQVMHAASQGDFSQRIDISNKAGFFRNLGEGLNGVLDAHSQLIEELMVVFAAIACGNLTQKVTRNYSGLLEQLRHDVNSTVIILVKLINAMKETVNTVSNAAEEISQGNSNLSQRTEQQASSLEETAASIEQMTSTVQQNTNNAEKASQLAIAASRRAQRGGTIVETAITAMTEINKSSKQVADISSVIDDIAFQTNLLALNAAVEAARAGEQGRGFAVVATEVRHLAQRSATAAKQIKNLIQDSVKKVEEGTRLVNESGIALEEIVKAVKEASNIIVEITAASREQSAGIQQINKAIVQLDEITQQNSALVEEAAVASGTMKEQAQNIKNQIMFFKTGQEEPTSSRQTLSKPKKPFTQEKLFYRMAEPTTQKDKEWEDF